MIAFVLAMALAAPNPTSIDAPRNAFRSCLKSFETNQLKAKVDAGAYASAVKTACPTEAQALADALVKYDVAMGTKRASAQANAQRDLEDYRLTSEERYRDMSAPQ